MNILVTGSRGQLGSEIERLSGRQKGVEFRFTDISELDIADRGAVERFCDRHRVGAIINCAAYTAVDKAEEEPEAAFRVNRDAAGVLAAVASSRDALLVHVSTDYVFGGVSCRPYREHDTADPLGIYGRSKWEGELAVRETASSWMIVRTSWLYSSFGSNFVRTMERLGAERESLNVVFDQVGSPTYAADLAGALLHILEHRDRTRHYAETYHYSNEGVCSWYDLAWAVMKLKGFDCRVRPVPSHEYPTPARRPHYSVLDKGKIKSDWKLDIPHWYDSLEKMLGKR
ncbi:dTDP-4-dehydrorhamnose reductase [Prosthecochloris sp. GSB1]|uniref:dTDP-4-dehydrorhamnose reductase n=1 Tax=Prosthecochloris sp. GSB1 TaxID=281093 RepID=UPI000B8C99E0|nr:dTDP-4-dehydrorhamnose reductase [Prosthecochloris sp. GSB1]ASQ89965.1 dTDP-4-dehydrorhamnose reductase [Prosthecochloris sp. GSB1]